MLPACDQSEALLEQGQTVALRFTVKQTDGSEVAAQALVSPPGRSNSNGLPGMLVALHGYGSSAAAFHDLWRPVADSLDLVLVTPQGECPLEPGHWAWGDAAPLVVHRAMALAVQQGLVNPRAVYMAGFSQGGTLAYTMTNSWPERFAGVAALGAPFDALMFTRFPERCRTRFYIGTGSEDNMVEQARQAHRFLSARTEAVLLEIYPGVGHGLPDPVETTLYAMMQWLMQ